ncbi:hypothetical protein SLITK23_22330 [Streptomyces lividans]|nr:hypothetical protein SLITK23_22330 [Streptomyces lividans]GHC26826.1 hypothetical protein GCM10010348_60940 [Streptomyces anthocyanicus]
MRRKAAGSCRPWYVAKRSETERYGVEASVAEEAAGRGAAGSDGHRGRTISGWGGQPFVPPAVRPVTRFFCTR